MQHESLTIKKDVTVLNISIKRSRKGLIVQAKADPSLEEIFRAWSGDVSAAPNTHGRLWEAPPNGKLPEVYALGILPDDGAPLRTFDGKAYRLDRTGVGLVDEYGINIGFLRMRGISGETGVSFVVKGVFSRDAIRAAAKDISSAVRKFYADYVQPIDMVLHMTSQEV